ncbi:MAG: hypothetical protein CVU46_11250 [Chloroflexi bacterium HGW-Chloroflexi-8]|nr:MAG: hypothetical protein CVU46_11250 [Chloroflexi bacterium HGW-Chloroflexi-8]
MDKKPKSKIAKNEQASPQIPEIVSQAAATYSVDPHKLLKWKVYSGGKVVLIAANGMKFVYEELEHDSQPQ